MSLRESVERLVALLFCWTVTAAIIIALGHYRSDRSTPLDPSCRTSDGLWIFF